MHEISRLFGPFLSYGFRSRLLEAREGISWKVYLDMAKTDLDMRFRALKIRIKSLMN